MQGEHGEDLGLAPPQRDRRPAVELQRGRVRAHQPQAEPGRAAERRRPPARPQLALRVVGRERVLGHHRRGRDQRQAVRVRGAGRAAQIHDAEQLARRRVVDRRGGAPPRVLAGEEVLGREDLDRVVDGQRGADGVRARARLRPQHALGEGDLVLRVAQHVVMTLEPEDAADLVAHDHHVLRVLGEVAEAVAQCGQGAHEQRAAARLVELVGGERLLRLERIGPQAGRLHARPGARDHRPHRRARRVVRHRRLPRVAQTMGVQAQIGRGVDRDELVSHGNSLALQHSRAPAPRLSSGHAADACVGIVANPASGRDVRRLVSGASVFGNADKAGMVLRALHGLKAGGTSRALMMPAADGLARRCSATCRTRRPWRSSRCSRCRSTGPRTTPRGPSSRWSPPG